MPTVSRQLVGEGLSPLDNNSASCRSSSATRFSKLDRDILVLSCRIDHREPVLVPRSISQIIPGLHGGENGITIAQMGFGVLTRIPIEREPLRIDWDRLDADRRVSLHRPRVRACAA